MTDNPWLPIDTMPLSTVGTEVDVLDGRRLYSGVTVSGLRFERGVIVDRQMDGREIVEVVAVKNFTVSHTRGIIRPTFRAQWRPHV